MAIHFTAPSTALQADDEKLEEGRTPHPPFLQAVIQTKLIHYFTFDGYQTVKAF